jgi:hypothetical protein
MQPCDQALEAPWVGVSPWDDGTLYDDDFPYCEICGEELVPGVEHVECWL